MCSANCSIICYVDDTTIITAQDNTEQGLQKVQEILDTIYQIIIELGLELNPIKFQYMKIHDKKVKPVKGDKKIEDIVNENKRIEKEQFKLWQKEEDAKRNQEMRNLEIRDQQRQAPRAERQLYPRIEPNINEIIEDQVNRRFQKLLDTQQQIENHIKIQNIDVDTSPRKDNN